MADRQVAMFTIRYFRGNARVADETRSTQREAISRATTVLEGGQSPDGAPGITRAEVVPFRGKTIYTVRKERGVVAVSEKGNRRVPPARKPVVPQPAQPDQRPDPKPEPRTLADDLAGLDAKDLVVLCHICRSPVDHRDGRTMELVWAFKGVEGGKSNSTAVTRVLSNRRMAYAHEACAVAWHQGG